MDGRNNRDARPKPRVVLFGEILFDEFPDGPVLGGAPLNVARHLLGLGIEPLVISRVGEDELGMLALQMMSDFGLETAGVQRDVDFPTALARVVLRGTGHYFELPELAAFDRIDTDKARDVALAFKPDAVYWGTLAQRSDTSAKALADFLDNVNGVRVLDMNLRTPWFGIETVSKSLSAAEIVKLNRDELEIVALLEGAGGLSRDELIYRMIDRNSINTLVVTDGPYGVSLTRADGKKTRVVGDPVVGVVDTVGAGDAVSAVVIAGKLLDWAPEQTCLRADALARAVCRIRGAAPRTNDFYAPFRQAWNVGATFH